MALIATFASVANHGLWTPDEPREAQIGSEMLASGFSAMPTLSGQPFVEKPPLFPWAVAASYAAFGTSAAAARVPAALFSVLSVLFAFLMARRIAGSVAGAAAAVVLLTMSKFATTGSTAINDTALTAFVAGGHFSFLIARDRPRRWAPLFVAGLCAAGAFMTKGIIGPILVGGPPVVALVLVRDWGTLRRIVPRALILCGTPVLAVATIWILALASDGGWEVVHESVINNTLGRTLGPTLGARVGRLFGGSGEAIATYGHSKPFWYYVKSFPVGILPWSLAIPAIWTSRMLDRGSRPARTRFAAALVLAGVAILSIPDGKRTLYFMPLLPATAAVVGAWVSRIGSRSGGRLDRGTLATLLGIVAAANLAVGSMLCWIAVWGAPSARLAPLEDVPGLVGVGVLALIGAGIAIVLTRRAWLGFDAALVRSALLFSLVVTITAAAFGRPLLDPMYELRTGSEHVAELVTSPECIVGLSLRETEQAALAFYSGRPVVNVARVRDLDRLADDGTLREFVVEDVKRTAALRRALREHYETIERVELKSGDFVLVCRARAGRAH